MNKQTNKQSSLVLIAGPEHPDLFHVEPTPTEIYIEAADLLAELMDPWRDSLAGFPAKLYPYR